MESLPIFTFENEFKRVLWGGSRLAGFKGMPSCGDHIGESWEISGIEGHESIVADGPYKGINLHDLLEAHGEALLGKALYSKYGNTFPLLIKFIDSADNLSIQVHPDDNLARQRHQCTGKTEMWVNIDPGEDAYLYCGLRRRLTPDEYRDSIADNSILTQLCKFYPKKDDVFMLPAGMIHSLGSNNFVLEIQQTSDITYRIYDYDRRDAQGNPRRLHVDESVDAVNFDINTDVRPSHIPSTKNTELEIADCPYFTSTAINLDGKIVLSPSKRRSFITVTVTEGSAELTAPDGAVTVLAKGHTALIPASMKDVAVTGKGRLVTAFIQ